MKENKWLLRRVLAVVAVLWGSALRAEQVVAAENVDFNGYPIFTRLQVPDKESHVPVDLWVML